MYTLEVPCMHRNRPWVKLNYILNGTYIPLQIKQIFMRPPVQNYFLDLCYCLTADQLTTSTWRHCVTITLWSRLCIEHPLHPHLLPRASPPPPHTTCGHQAALAECIEGKSDSSHEQSEGDSPLSARGGPGMETQTGPCPSHKQNRRVSCPNSENLTTLIPSSSTLENIIIFCTSQ